MRLQTVQITHTRIDESRHAYMSCGSCSAVAAALSREDVRIHCADHVHTYGYVLSDILTRHVGVAVLLQMNKGV